MDEYWYLEPPYEGATIEKYVAVLDERYDGFHETARLYAKMLKSVDGDGAKARLIQHWKKYTAATSTIHRVKYELAAYGKLPDGYEYGADVKHDAVSAQGYRPVPN